MDPDMVRQQAEEEAASRILHSRGAPPPEIRIEPALPMSPQTMSAQTMSAQFSNSRFASGFEKMAPPPVPIVVPAWGAAINIATSCAIATTLGLVGGLMLGVKLHMVAWQGVAIGAAAGTALGWRLSSLALLKNVGLGPLRAHGAAFRMALLILAVMASAMFVMPHFTGPSAGPNQPFDVMTFWKSVAVGGLTSIILGAAMLRRILRRA